MSAMIATGDAELLRTQPQTWRWAGVALLVACLLAASVSRAAFLARPFRNDSGLYAYMGKVVAEGGVLYHDFYENKPPGVALVAAACWRLFANHWAGYVAIQWAMAILGALMLARAAVRHVGEHAWRPTLVATLVLLNFYPVVYTGFQLETIQAFFAILCACAAAESLRSRHLIDAALVGLAAGCAAMIKPSGLAPLAAWGVALVLWGRGAGVWSMARQITVALIGAALPSAGVLWWVVRSGLWPDMPELLRQIRLYGQETPLDGVLVKALVLAVFLGFPMLVRGWIFRRRGESMTDRPVGRDLLWFTIGWLVLETAGVFLQGRMYLYHFLVIFPPAALLYGMLPRTDRALPMAMGLGPIALISLCWSVPYVWHAPRGMRPLAASEYVRQRTLPGDAIYADQAPRYLLETDRRPGSRLGTLFYFVNYDEAPLDYCRVLLGDFEARRPRYILLRADLDEVLKDQEQLPLLSERPRRLANFRTAWARLREYVAIHYVLETQAGDQLVYRRREGNSGIVASAR